MSGFDPISPAQSFTEGFNSAQNVVDTERKNAAYNALQKVYGDQAGDPQSAGMLANTSIAQQKAQQENQANLQQQGLMTARLLKGMVDSGVDPAQAFDKVAPLLPSLGVDPAHVAPFKQVFVNAPAQTIDHIVQALQGPTQVTGAPIMVQNPDGTYGAVKTDKFGNVIPLNLPAGAQPTAPVQGEQRIGVQQGRLDETGRHNRANEGIAQQRANTGAFSAASAAANRDFAPDGVGPATTTAPQGTPQAAPQQRPQAQPSAAQGVPFAHLTPKGRQGAIDSASNIKTMGTYVDNADTLAKSMYSQIAPYSTGVGALASYVPGSTATNLDHNAATLRGLAAQLVIQGMKNAKGQTGMGRILQSEYQNFTSMLGNLDLKQSPAQYRQHLDLAIQSIHKLYNISNRSFSQKYGVSADEALGAPRQQAPAPAPLSQSQQTLLKKYGL